MLAARDQENLVHSHQTAAAAKPMNQTVRPLQARTPGNKAPKTPFKVPLNDENNPAAFGGKKTVRAGNVQNENVLRLGGKDGGKNDFVTPMGPRNRAPLGMKTTNAKAKAFQTPAAQPETTKPLKTGKRSSTVRKVKQALPELQENTTQDVETTEPEEERDVEYCPPKPKDLPDVPDDYITYNTDFPQFKGANFSRGWAKLYDDNPVGEDGLTRRQREMNQRQEEYYRKMDEAILRDVENMDIREEDSDEPYAEDIAAKMTKKRDEVEKPKRTASTDRPVSTLRSREAARALSQQPPTAVSQAKPRTTIAPRSTSRLASALTGPKKQPTPTNPSAMRHTAAAAGSRTTLGYSKGRTVSSTLREKSTNGTVRMNVKPASSSKSNSILSPEKYIEMYGPPPFGTEMWSRCKAAGCFDADAGIVDADEEILKEIGSSKPYEEDEETANFQLTL